MNANDLTVKDLLMGFAEIINDQKSEMPTGCISKSTNGAFNARSIVDVSDLSNNVNAPDGFIKDGLLVRFVGQKKDSVLKRWSGYMVTFELNGAYNGTYVIFTKTELEYKIYLTRDSWQVVEATIDYVPVNEGVEAFKRIYKEVQTKEPNAVEFRCVDKRATVENKVAYAMKNKLAADYDAYMDGLLFNEDNHKFEAVENNEETI